MCECTFWTLKLYIQKSDTWVTQGGQPLHTYASAAAVVYFRRTCGRHGTRTPSPWPLAGPSCLSPSSADDTKCTEGIRCVQRCRVRREVTGAEDSIRVCRRDSIS
jgi:hypothetical protein